MQCLLPLPPHLEQLNEPQIHGWLWRLLHWRQCRELLEGYGEALENRELMFMEYLRLKLRSLVLVGHQLLQC